MATAFPIRRSLVLLVCFLSAPAAARAQSAAAALVLSLEVARPHVLFPQTVREAFPGGGWGLGASAAYAFASRLEVGAGYDLLSVERRNAASGESGGSATVQAISLLAGFGSAPELPVQVFLRAGPALVLASDETGSRFGAGLSGHSAGAVGRIGLRVPLGEGVYATAGGSALLFDSLEFVRMLGTLQLGFTLLSPLPSPTP